VFSAHFNFILQNNVSAREYQLEGMNQQSKAFVTFLRRRIPELKIPKRTQKAQNQP